MFHVEVMGVACATCHRGYVVSGIPAERSVNPALHMNGVADVVLEDGTVIQTANLPDHSWPVAECTACHGALGLTDIGQ